MEAFVINMNKTLISTVIIIMLLLSLLLYRVTIGNNQQTAEQKTENTKPSAVIAGDKYNIEISRHNELKVGSKLLVMKKGGEIKWINKDDTPLTVTVSELRYESKKLRKEQSDRLKMDVLGSYDFKVKEFPNLKGSITVIN